MDFVRLKTGDTKGGVSTFQPDFKNNLLHGLLQQIGAKHGKVIDLSGADRSDRALSAGLSEINHNSQNAVDVSFKGNPSWFHANGTPTASGEDLIRTLLQNGIRVGDGKGHAHFDMTPAQGPLKLEQVFREKGGLGNLKRFASKAFNGLQKASEPEINTADKLRKKIAESDRQEEQEFNVNDAVQKALNKQLGSQIHNNKAKEEEADERSAAQKLRERIDADFKNSALRVEGLPLQL
jgi:hypothetical protein